MVADVSIGARAAHDGPRAGQRKLGAPGRHAAGGKKGGLGPRGDRRG